MEKWERRERKLRKRRSQDMVVSNRSIKTVLLPALGKQKEGEKRERKRRSSRP